MGDVELLFPTKSLKLLHKYDTVYSSDSVEWCPHDPYQNYFVCANYQLTEAESQSENDSKPRTRLGRILLISIDINKGLTLHQTIETAAVLDQKWCHNRINDKIYLGVVNAKKTLEVYEFNDGNLNLYTNISIEDDERETLMLSLDWSTGKYESNSPEIACSDSKGNIHRFVFSEGKLINENSWHAHHFEAWIVAFYYWDANVLFTGGDDGLFLKFDKRVGEIPVAKNRSHESGVTCMHANSSKEFVLATGSYDAHLRIWDVRQMKSPRNTLQMPETMWRVKWDPFKNDHLLTACMMGGVHVVECVDLEDMKIVESFYDHKNLAYGADWCYSKELARKYPDTGNIIIGSCSFYDHLLCVYKIKIE